MDIEGTGRAAAGVGDVRVLHPLRVIEGPTGVDGEPGTYGGVAVDVETSGLDHRKGRIIELAMRRFRYNRAGEITEIDRAYEWREDPGEPLPAEIIKLTGITDADLAGREIDEDVATRVLCSTSFVAAHHSNFDRRWIEDRLPRARGLRWACSMEDIDWRAQGFDGRSLGFLLMQAGFYHCGHRASADVDAMIQLLRLRFDDGRTALAHMIESASKPRWRFRARGAYYAVKDLLKERKYRWDSDAKVWWRDVGDENREHEEWWLAANVYSDGRVKALGPDIDRITARNRFLPLDLGDPAPQ